MKLGRWQNSHLYSLAHGSLSKTFLAAVGYQDLKHPFALDVQKIHSFRFHGPVTPADTQDLNRTLIQKKA